MTTRPQRERLFVAAILCAANLATDCKRLGVPTDDIKQLCARIKRLAADEGIDLDALLNAEHDQMSVLVAAALKED
jgi:hypothetical protein